jgi:hypothetical protein
MVTIPRVWLGFAAGYCCGVLSLFLAVDVALRIKERMAMRPLPDQCRPLDPTRNDRAS